MYNGMDIQRKSSHTHQSCVLNFLRGSSPIIPISSSLIALHAFVAAVYDIQLISKIAKKATFILPGIRIGIVYHNADIVWDSCPKLLQHTPGIPHNTCSVAPRLVPAGRQAQDGDWVAGAQRADNDVKDAGGIFYHF